jgi:hypothetical protein
MYTTMLLIKVRCSPSPRPHHAQQRPHHGALTVLGTPGEACIKLRIRLRRLRIRLRRLRIRLRRLRIRLRRLRIRLRRLRIRLRRLRIRLRMSTRTTQISDVYRLSTRRTQTQAVYLFSHMHKYLCMQTCLHRHACRCPHKIHAHSATQAHIQTQTQAGLQLVCLKQPSHPLQ